MEALRELDGEVVDTPKYRKFMSRAQWLRKLRDGGGEGTALQ
jgi:hypothetical protein